MVRPSGELENGVTVGERRLSQAQFQKLNEIPHFLEWLANISNPNTRRAYRHDLAEFMTFVGLREPEEFSRVNRAHVLAWRKDLEQRPLKPATIRRKLSAVSVSLQNPSDRRRTRLPPRSVLCFGGPMAAKLPCYFRTRYSNAQFSFLNLGLNYYKFSWLMPDDTRHVVLLARSSFCTTSANFEEMPTNLGLAYEAREKGFESFSATGETSKIGKRLGVC